MVCLNSVFLMKYSVFVVKIFGIENLGLVQIFKNYFFNFMNWINYFELVLFSMGGVIKLFLLVEQIYCISKIVCMKLKEVQLC